MKPKVERLQQRPTQKEPTLEPKKAEPKNSPSHRRRQSPIEAIWISLGTRFNKTEEGGR